VSDDRFSRRRLFLDVETPPIPVWVFALNDKSNARISHKNIVSGYSYGIICACWKWAGEKKVHSLDWGQRQNDKALVRGMIAAMDEADEIVMQNGNRFDVRWIRGRAIYHRLPMRPNYVTNDTLLKGRQKFHFPSFRLDYMGNHLLNDEKIPTSFALWKSIMEDRCVMSLGKMIRYCKKDVTLLEDIFDVMAPYLEPVSSVARHICDCPECGSSRTVVRKEYRTKVGHDRVNFVCLDCKHPHTVAKGRYDKAKSKAAA
jgi:hypothetical protein